MLVWVLALGGMVLLVTAIQVAAYYYLVHDDGPPGAVDPDPDAAGIGDPTGNRRERTASDDDRDRATTRRCTECGTPNATDPVYTFCRHCGAEL